MIMDLIRNYVTNKNGSDGWETLYREPMGRSVLHYKKSKNLSGEAYIQSSNTNSPGIIKTSQKIGRLSKTCIFWMNVYMPHLWISYNVIHSETITSS